MPLFLLPLLKWIGSFLTGPLLQGALDAYKAKLKNDNDADGRTTDLLKRELDVEQREREVNANVVLAEQGHWWTSCVRPLFAAPFVIYVWKLIVWDKVLGWGVTDPLSDWLSSMATVILTAYFGGRSIEKVAAILKRK